jgi:hypothetical protein
MTDKLDGDGELAKEHFQLHKHKNKSRELTGMRWAGHVARMGEEGTQVFGGKACKKENTRKTEVQKGGWDPNGS